jgi:type I restriction enzyme S subunit
MAMLKPYPEYKDSGVAWLGEIPVHWDIRRGKFLFRCIDVRSATGDEELLTVSARDSVVPRQQKTVTMFMAESYVGHKLCWPGDLVINSLWAWAQGLGFSRHHGIISSAYGVYRLRPQLSDLWQYFDYLLRSKAYDWELHVRSKGIWTSRLQLTDDSFLDMPIILPPHDEAATIVRLLTGVRSRINRLIRAKRRLIELLSEQKQAIIHRAVTRGIDPNVRLKPSGIDWLGDVLAHWEVAGLRMRYSVQLGKMLDAKRITGSHLVPYLRNTDVQWDRVNTSDLPMMDIREDEYPRYTVQPGDLLVCEGGEVGRAAFWEGSLPICGYQKALHRLRPPHASRDFPRFLFYVLFSVSKRGVFVADGSENTIAHLTAEKLRRYRFAFPPKNEQEMISSHLDATLADLDRAIEKANREIDLLREYRIRLITDVVTGKLDVRGVELPTLNENRDGGRSRGVGRPRQRQRGGIEGDRAY